MPACKIIKYFDRFAKKQENYLEIIIFAHANTKTMFLIHAPTAIKAAINLPSSKSISNRALILNALSKCRKTINNLSDCDDTAVMVNALRERKTIIDVGAAGTAMRFLTAYLAGQPGDYLLTGTERMKNRPVKILVDALRAVGAQIEYTEKEGFPPLQIKGQIMKGGEIELDGSVSSQYVSALLMIAPMMTRGLNIQLIGNVVSTSYIDLTLHLMAQFGVIVNKEGCKLTVLPQQYDMERDYHVESDWSAASYWYEMIALSDDKSSSVMLNGLWSDSLQGDAAIKCLFDRLGVKTLFTPLGATLTKKDRIIDRPLVFDFLSMPDMAQTGVVTCTMLHIPFRFTGLQSLKIKETDRLFALKTELRKLGFLLEIQNDDTLVWNGERCEVDAYPVIATYEDHRMAMAFTPASLCRKEGIYIANPQVVSKSYPSFWNDLLKANFFITETE